jgi:hypothetical protein
LIINDSTYPINPLEGTSTAWNVSLRLNYFRNLLHVGYKSIGSQYYSLTNDWIRTDIAGFYFSDRLRLFSNKHYLTLGYENFKDNLAQEDARPSVDLQTLNYSLSWYPEQVIPISPPVCKPIIATTASMLCGHSHRIWAAKATHRMCWIFATTKNIAIYP